MEEINANALGKLIANSLLEKKLKEEILESLPYLSDEKIKSLYAELKQLKSAEKDFLKADLKADLDLKKIAD
jgi:hypothetical protein